MSIFDSVQTPNPGYNKFDLSYTNTLTSSMGDMIPVYMEHLLPGDKFRVKSNLFARLMPLATPAFGNLRMIMRYFFVPYRLLFSSQDSLDPRSFDYFITGGTSDGGKEQVYQPYFPKFDFSNEKYANVLFGALQPGTLFDYFGVNTARYNVEDGGNITIPEFTFSALPHLAYNRIYNDWYRDETIDEPYPYYITEDIKFSESDEFWYTYAKPHKARWHKDYFTSALISPTNGAPEQALPLVGGDMAVLGNFATDLYKPANGGIVTLSSDGNFNFIEYDQVNSTDGKLEFTDSSGYPMIQGPLNASGTEGALYADGADQYMASIRDLRNSIATQRFLEISARGGNRYIEQIFAHFGVRSLDARLQRAEFLGGGITPINIGEVLQTSESASTPLGQMAGRGVAYGTDNSCNYYATEHGILMGIMTIQPEATYFQGLSRHFKKFDRLDYYWPSFAHIGDQEIKNYEIFNHLRPANENYADLNDVFGYAPRYAEYKHHSNEMHGEFKTSLASWMFTRAFSNSPKLNSEFLEVPNITHPFADTEDNAKFIIHISHKVDALRKMPYYGNPSLIG